MFVASITNVLIVAADSPLKSVGGLIAAAKEAPGNLSFASSGAGSSTHMSAELFKAWPASTCCTCRTRAAARRCPTSSPGACR